MGARVGVVAFPGTNCEHDVVQALRALGGEADVVWHTESSLEGLDAIVVPGGFAHGDYLRPGAIARFSPVMEAVAAFSASRPVLGICNGFQVLTEAGLLPGSLMANAGLRFLSMPVDLEVTSTTTVLTRRAELGAVLTLPINHYEGNYVCPASLLDEMEAAGQVVLRYRDNPNGSMHTVAGVASPDGNVVGLMPHPERATGRLLASRDGEVLFESFLDAAADHGARDDVAASA